MKIAAITRCLTAALVLSCASQAGEKKLMHCFAFTPIDGATDADWSAFYKATDALTGKIPGLTKVWYGKLRRPLATFATDAETRKKMTKDAPKGTGEFTLSTREHGVCMEMESEKTLETYAANPAHKEWEAVYSKVRKPGTTTIDILGQ